ncbi:hypothetical protein B0H21DRAFT_817645 [Amylocystis lapponica]|nr:hypothetical protein B0H21DRAFT_817645 [Amylocystis lapponica]
MSCSLTCRGWRPKARTLLFHTVFLDGEEEYRQYEEFFEEHPEIARCVRNLTLVAGHGDPPSWLPSNLPRILRTLNRVEDVTFNMWYASQMSEEIRHQLPTLFPMVSTLRLKDIDSERGDELLLIICACPRLKALYIAREEVLETVETSPPDAPLPASRPRLIPAAKQPIEELILVACDPPIVEWMLKGPLELRLRRLNVSWTPQSAFAPEAPYTQRLLREAGATLEHLMIHLTMIPDLPTDGGYPDLSDNCGLVALTFTGIALIPDNRGQWDTFPVALAQKLSMRLEIIRLTISIPDETTDNLALLNWEQVDQHLVALARDRPRLEVYIKVVCTAGKFSGGDMEKAIKRLMPLVEAKEGRLTSHRAFMTISIHQDQHV